LLALTGDEHYYFDCTRKAIQAGLYLNEWGLWQWEPDSKTLSRFQTSDAPHEKTSLGTMWGSEAEMDERRWVRLDTLEEEQILSVIGGEYVPPDKRNFGFIMGQARLKRGRVAMKNP
jgi:DNA polymerase beta